MSQRFKGLGIRLLLCLAALACWTGSWEQLRRVQGFSDPSSCWLQTQLFNFWCSCKVVDSESYNLYFLGFWASGSLAVLKSARGSHVVGDFPTSCHDSGAE